MGELDLQFGFTRFRPGRKDVEDQLVPVDHLELGERGDAVELARGQFFVEDEHTRAKLPALHGDLLDLALSHEEFRMELLGSLNDRVKDRQADRIGEVLELGDPFFHVLRFARKHHYDEYALFSSFGLRHIKGSPLLNEFTLQFVDEFGEVDVELVHGHGADEIPDLPFLVVGYEIAELDQLDGLARPLQDAGDEVELQQGQVGEVFFGKDSPFRWV